MKNVATIAVSLIICTSVVAQDKLSLYYSSSWKITDSTNHVYKRIAEFDHVKLVFHGKYKDYDRNGGLVGEGNYENGIKTGVANTYYPGGKLLSSVEYKDRSFTIRELNSENENLVMDGTGKFSILITYRNTDGWLAGEFKNFKRTGTWTFFEGEDFKTLEETYKDGEFQKGTAYYKRNIVGYVPPEIQKSLENQLSIVENSQEQQRRGIYITPDESLESMNIDTTQINTLYQVFPSRAYNSRDSLTIGVRYAGGMDNLFRQIYKSLKYPIEAIQNGIKGRVIIAVTVGTDGVVKKYDLISRTDRLLNVEALRVLQSLDERWFPALLKGEPYETTASIPITFGLK
jgi:TonB family protein